MNNITGKQQYENYSIMEWYRFGASCLRELQCGSPQHEALLLCEHFFGIKGRTGLAVHGADIPSEKASEGYRLALGQREVRPLQYILGRWEFCGLPLYVGEGVLVPREDTVPLVESVCEYARNIDRPRILDLCSGSGAVALAVAEQLPNAQCVCGELSEDALYYLNKNVEVYGQGRVSIRRVDVLRHPQENGFDRSERYDVICANPPYIETAVIETLGREVRQEPHMALDGGEDGLMFYRAITRLWTPLLRYGGMLTFELGAGQHTSVADVMKEHNLTNIGTKNDMSGIVRVINGILM